MSAALKIGYARVSTEGQDVTAQRNALEALGVDAGRIYVDHGLTGTNRSRPAQGRVPALQRRALTKSRRARKPSAAVAVGVDVGLSRLMTMSTGQTALNSRPLKAALTTLRRLQRQPAAGAQPRHRQGHDEEPSPGSA